MQTPDPPPYSGRLVLSAIFRIPYNTWDKISTIHYFCYSMGKSLLTRSFCFFDRDTFHGALKNFAWDVEPFLAPNLEPNLLLPRHVFILFTKLAIAHREQPIGDTYTYWNIYIYINIYILLLLLLVIIQVYIFCHILSVLIINTY